MTESEFREYSLSGNLFHLIIQVGTPLAIFAVFNCLFSILDTMMASRLGTISVSTVAYLNQLRMILNALGSGLITGSMILINRAYGAGRNDEAALLMNTLVRLLAILSFLFLLLIPFVPSILRAIATPEEFIEEGTPYFRTLLVATIFNYINLLYINIEKARGRTKVIMAVNIASMILKLILTALFIYVLEKGIVYIALATLITYIAFTLYALPHITEKNSIFRIQPRLVFHGRKGYARKLIAISCPVAIEDSAFSLGKTVVNSMAASYGAEMIGALGISNNMSGLVTNFENGFSDASSSIISQNYGAGKYDRIRQGVRQCSILSLSVAIGMAWLNISFGVYFVELFVGEEDPLLPQISELAQMYMGLNAPLYWVLGLLFVYRYTLQGLGKSFVPTFAGVMELVMRIGASVLFAAPLGFGGICLASPLAWIGAAVPLGVAYFYVIRRLDYMDSNGFSSSTEDPLGEVVGRRRNLIASD